VTPDDEASCTVEWAARFEAEGAPEADAEAAIQGSYEAGLDAL